MPPEPPMVLVAGRQEGKSTEAFRWLSQGVRTDSYPGWTRIVIVANLQILDFHRNDWYSKIPDFSHRVYALEEITGSATRGGWRAAAASGLEICLDDLDLLLRFGLDYRYLPGRVTAITITGRAWEDQVYVEPELQD